MTDQDLMSTFPPMPPQAGLVWTAIVDVGDPVDLGPARGGQRFMVPISGGRFYEGLEGEGLSGTVLAGGADRQFLRADGVKELEAIYEMKTYDGTFITIENRVVVDTMREPDHYAMSTITAKVRDGPFGWLNRRVLVGTLQTARPDRNAVIIRAWIMKDVFEGLTQAD
ncbi:MAG: DUF3237 domain-containing protein [Maritimibacter sp.]|uniref:DUF3237 domain-containing protein n=1 Tax=Maritimibacter sp. TaxID=2003363 RepID=UPI001D549CEA|nr:DUF3237 domain-containing protein [Maritimibacter sp.]MBL6426758.1 DUF3237 domain-containing protein [Maritimibacter sp.]